MKRDNNGKFTYNTEHKVIKVINERYDKFEYIGGYVNADSFMYLMCKDCGNIFKHSTDILRPSRRKIIKCKVCSGLYKDKDIKNKKIEKEKKREEKLKYKLKKNLPKERITYMYKCYQCGETFISERAGKKYCSNKCMNRHNNTTKSLNRRKKIKTNGDIDNDISLAKLIKRDKNICYICGTRCDKQDYKLMEDKYFIAGKTYPSIDHVVSVSKGGTHAWHNVKLAHCYCNSVKSDRNVCEESGQMIMMM